MLSACSILPRALSTFRTPAAGAVKEARTSNGRGEGRAQECAPRDECVCLQEYWEPQVCRGYPMKEEHRNVPTAGPVKEVRTSSGRREGRAQECAPKDECIQRYWEPRECRRQPLEGASPPQSESSWVKRDDDVTKDLSTGMSALG